jgi:hypothetical protein
MKINHTTMNIQIRLLLLVLLNITTLRVYAQDYFSMSGGYFFDKVTENTLDARMAHKGQLMDGLSWKDESGENVLFVCYDAVAAQQKRDIYVYQYRKVGDKCSLVWDIQDFGGNLCEMTFIDNSLQLIDLDNDGILEACFMYQNRCDGNDPTVTKMMLLKDGKKLAIRGKFALEDGKELEKTIDPVVAQFPPIFKNFMLMNWNEFKEGEFEFAKSVHIRTKDYIVLKREYQLASGGTSYQLLDLNGLPLPLGNGMVEKINYPHEVALMPDRKTLLYSGIRGVGTYDPVSKVENVWMTFFEDTEAVSSLVWSPDKTKIAFTALNLTQYPQKTRIFVLTCNGNKMGKKEKFDAKLLHMAASDWVVESPRFKDNHTLQYVEMVIVDNETGEGEVKTIVLE